jgi:hypothetical protein
MYHVERQLKEELKYNKVCCYMKLRRWKWSVAGEKNVWNEIKEIEQSGVRLLLSNEIELGLHWAYKYN